VDQLDKKLLAELQNKGFQKATSLAHVLDVSERTIRRRISEMKSKGVIKIVALPNPVLFGYRAWAKVGIRVESGSSYHVVSQLVAHPAVYFVAYAIGAFDIIIAVHFHTMDRLAHFANSELTAIRGILNTETMPLIHPRKYYHFSWQAPVCEETKSGCEHYLDVTASREHYHVDETDRAILGILREDGLTRLATLKSRLGIGENTIRKRIKNMLNNGLFRIEVVPNTEVLEDEAWATMGITINLQSAHTVLDTVIKHPAVYLASVSLGRFNLVIAVRFHTIDLLYQFINTDLPAIKGVSSVETFLHNKPVKYHSINWLHLINH